MEKDDYILSLVQWLYAARRVWGLTDIRYRRIGSRLIRDRKVDGGQVVIVLNGPSVKTQPIERIKGCDAIFVNQGFRLPCYKQVHPKYHVFIDTKLIHGVWDIHWLDEILDLVPDITFAMPAHWAKTHLLRGKSQ